MHHTIGQVLLPIMLSPRVPQKEATQVSVETLEHHGFETHHCSTGHENLNKWFQSGDQAHIIVASAMVLLMVPGLGFLYSGLAPLKSALSMMWACVGAGSVITF